MRWCRPHPTRTLEPARPHEFRLDATPPERSPRCGREQGHCWMGFPAQPIHRSDINSVSPTASARASTVATSSSPRHETRSWISGRSSAFRSTTSHQSSDANSSSSETYSDHRTSDPSRSPHIGRRRRTIGSPRCDSGTNSRASRPYPSLAINVLWLVMRPRLTPRQRPHPPAPGPAPVPVQVPASGREGSHPG